MSAKNCRLGNLVKSKKALRNLSQDSVSGIAKKTVSWASNVTADRKHTENTMGSVDKHQNIVRSPPLKVIGIKKTMVNQLQGMGRTSVNRNEQPLPNSLRNHPKPSYKIYGNTGIFSSNSSMASQSHRNYHIDTSGQDSGKSSSPNQSPVQVDTVSYMSEKRDYHSVFSGKLTSEFVREIRHSIKNDLMPLDAATKQLLSVKRNRPEEERNDPLGGWKHPPRMDEIPTKMPEKKRAALRRQLYAKNLIPLVNETSNTVAPWSTGWNIDLSVIGRRMNQMYLNNSKKDVSQRRSTHMSKQSGTSANRSRHVSQNRTTATATAKITKAAALAADPRVTPRNQRIARSGDHVRWNDMFYQNRLETSSPSATQQKLNQQIKNSPLDKNQEKQEEKPINANQLQVPSQLQTTTQQIKNSPLDRNQEKQEEMPINANQLQVPSQLQTAHRFKQKYVRNQYDQFNPIRKFNFPDFQDTKLYETKSTFNRDNSTLALKEYLQTTAKISKPVFNQPRLKSKYQVMRSVGTNTNISTKESAAKESATSQMAKETNILNPKESRISHFEHVALRAK